MLRQLAQYHAKDPNNLFMVRLAQVGAHHHHHHHHHHCPIPLSTAASDCVDTTLFLCPLLPLTVLTCCTVLQGLTHLGKGTLTLCPYHSDRQLMSQVAVAGLLTVLVSFLDVKNSMSISCSPPSLSLEV